MRFADCVKDAEPDHVAVSWKGREPARILVANRMLEQLPAPAQVGKTMVGGIDLNKPRMRRVVEAVIALSPSPSGFTASASKGRPIMAPAALRMIGRNSAARRLRGAPNPQALDTHYDTIRTAMRGGFQELGLIA